MALVKLNNRGVRSATTFGSITGLGSMVFIKKVTASSSATVSFVDGTSDVVLDNTYKEYLFTFNNIHPATNGVQFLFQGSTNTGSAYGVTATTTYFDATHNEGDTAANLGYDTDDQAQSTDFIYAVFAEEFGFIGSAMLLLFLILGLRNSLTKSLYLPTLIFQLLQHPSFYHLILYP